MMDLTENLVDAPQPVLPNRDEVVWNGFEALYNRICEAGGGQEDFSELRAKCLELLQTQVDEDPNVLTAMHDLVSQLKVLDNEEQYQIRVQVLKAEQQLADHQSQLEEDLQADLAEKLTSSTASPTSGILLLKSQLKHGEIEQQQMTYLPGMLDEMQEAVDTALTEFAVRRQELQANLDLLYASSGADSDEDVDDVDTITIQSVSAHVEADTQTEIASMQTEMTETEMTQTEMTETEKEMETQMEVTSTQTETAPIQTEAVQTEAGIRPTQSETTQTRARMTGMTQTQTEMTKPRERIFMHTETTQTIEGTLQVQSETQTPPKGARLPTELTPAPAKGHVELTPEKAAVELPRNAQMERQGSAVWVKRAGKWEQDAGEGSPPKQGHAMVQTEAGSTPPGEESAVAPREGFAVSPEHTLARRMKPHKLFVGRLFAGGDGGEGAPACARCLADAAQILAVAAVVFLVRDNPLQVEALFAKIPGSQYLAAAGRGVQLAVRQMQRLALVVLGVGAAVELDPAAQPPRVALDRCSRELAQRGDTNVMSAARQSDWWNGRASCLASGERQARRVETVHVMPAAVSKAEQTAKASVQRRRSIEECLAIGLCPRTATRTQKFTEDGAKERSWIQIADDKGHMLPPMALSPRSQSFAMG
ncbi:hypothetical protein CYMTET_15363 [Cymbomonas tetramitiformis]|uniref:Uncharacterized protein n=1 Tax=Cymbomonas tetramitiformis TaxID=36881 RepID=A0AAE0GED9_9CHLO|nr:hypothetical protein CYMTET_15363 [Cymbomonas tetramitiformis]